MRGQYLGHMIYLDQLGGQTWLEVFVTRLWFIDSDIRAPTSALLTRNSCVTNTCVERIWKMKIELRNSKMTPQELLYTQTGRNSKVIIKQTSVKGDCKKCWRLCLRLLERNCSVEKAISSLSFKEIKPSADIYKNTEYRLIYFSVA
jgi:hypothetical protein